MTLFDKRLMTSRILIHLQKAFDKIDHGILLQRLYALGFSKHTVNRFQFYLSNTSFLVDFGHNFSYPSSVSCCLPEGFILGALLFLIYGSDVS